MTPALARKLPIRALGRRARTAGPANRTDSGLFQLGVHGADPTTDAFVLWTQVMPAEARTRRDETAPSQIAAGPAETDIPVDWELSREPDFRSVVGRGRAVSRAARSHTVKVDVGGLEPDTTYFFRFIAESETSSVGCTRTTRELKRRSLSLRV